MKNLLEVRVLALLRFYPIIYRITRASLEHGEIK